MTVEQKATKMVREKILPKPLIDGYNLK